MNLRGTDLNLLTVFEAVYEERSQLKAAERLRMTQPAISNALRRLKLVAQDPLFVARKNLGLQPTPCADELYDRVHQALNLIRTGLSADGAFDPAESYRHFSVSMVYGGGSLMSTALYQAIHSEAPNARLSIHSIDSEKEAIGKLRDRSLDVLVHYNRFADPSLAHDLVYQHQMVIVARRDHPRIGDSFTPEQALREHFVAVNGHYPSLSANPEQETWFDRVNERISLQVPNVMILLQAVARTDLLAFASQRLAHTFQDQFGIKCYPVPWQVERVPIYMIWHRSAQSDPVHRWLREKIKESARATWLPPIEQRERTQQQQNWLFRLDTYSE